MSSNILRTDLIPPELLRDPEFVKTIVESDFQILRDNSQPLEKNTTPGNAKDIIEIGELIEKTITDYETREHATQDKKIEIFYERPEQPFDNEAITISFVARAPGMYGQGRPGENKIKNLRPVLRQLVDDPDNPGYKRAVLGYFYDNTIRLTCWARTNKVANKRAIWLENLMEEYTWWFRYQGVNRLLYEGWKMPVLIDLHNTVYFGRPIDFFVRTEKLWNVSQKTLEQIYIRLASTT